MNLEEAQKFLIGYGWLSKTEPYFRDAVIARSHFKLVKPGEVLFLAGDEPRGLFGLAGGAVSASIAPDDSIPLIAHFFLPGSWFGEIPALTGRGYIVGLKATRESFFLQLPMSSLRSILDADPRGWRFLGLLAAEHTELSVGVVSDLMRRDSNQRFIALLMRMAGCRTDSKQNTPAAEVRVSQEDLAAISNLARTTVSSILQGLEKTGLIELRYRCIRVINQEGLRELIDRS